MCGHSVVTLCKRLEVSHLGRLISSRSHPQGFGGRRRLRWSFLHNAVTLIPLHTLHSMEAPLPPDPQLRVRLLTLCVSTQRALNSIQTQLPRDTFTGEGPLG